MKIAAIVPMRHSSERVPGKNYRDFAGKPLYHHVVESLLACPSITQVVIDTDSPVILEDAAQHFPKVTLLKRPEHLQAGDIPMNDVLLNTINQLDADFFLQTHSTNPLLSAESVNKGVSIFLKNYPIYDSLFTVTRLQTRLWDELARAVNHNPNILLRTQDLPPIYEENSCMYIFSKAILERKHNRIGDRPYMLEIPKEEAQDIDVEIEFQIAEFLFKARKDQATLPNDGTVKWRLLANHLLQPFPSPTDKFAVIAKCRGHAAHTLHGLFAAALLKRLLHRVLPRQFVHPFRFAFLFKIGHFLQAQQVNSHPKVALEGTGQHPFAALARTLQLVAQKGTAIIPIGRAVVGVFPAGGFGLGHPFGTKQGNDEVRPQA
jgi:CMP-N-acetylneuraminic acid synthetase